MTDNTKYPQYKLLCNSRGGLIPWEQSWNPPSRICHKFNYLKHGRKPFNVMIFSEALTPILETWIWFYVLLEQLDSKFVVVPPPTIDFSYQVSYQYRPMYPLIFSSVEKKPVNFVNGKYYDIEIDQENSN